MTDRWLSLLSLVNFIIEQYYALKLYFTNAILKDKITLAQTIIDTISNSFNLLYLFYHIF